MAVGCGQSDTERLEEENRRLKAELESNKLKALKAETDKTKKEPPTNPTDQNTTKAKPVKEQARELTPEEKKVVGEYERKEDGDTFRVVLLENGIVEFSENGEKKKDGTWEMPLLRFELGKQVHVGYENFKSFLAATHVFEPGVPQAVNQLLDVHSDHRFKSEKIDETFLGKSYSELFNYYKNNNQLCIGIYIENVAMGYEQLFSSESESSSSLSDSSFFFFEVSFSLSVVSFSSFSSESSSSSSSSRIIITSPTFTSSPSLTFISLIVPPEVAGTSAVALSVSTEITD